MLRVPHKNYLPPTHSWPSTLVVNSFGSTVAVLCGDRLLAKPTPLYAPLRIIRMAERRHFSASRRESTWWSEVSGWWVGSTHFRFDGKSSSLAVAGVLMAAMLPLMYQQTASPSSALCSPDSSATASSNNEENERNPEQQNKNEDEQDDIYANLPDEDEETNCSMCNTFRQGPCRPEWRRLERCFKDNEQTNNVAVNCMRYFRPHQECLMQYSNLYQLISLDMKQDIVQDTERAIAKHEKRLWNPVIHWDKWISFVKDAGVNYRQTTRHYPVDKKPRALWKRLPENTEPILLELTASLPRRDEEKGLILKLAYALDQDGITVGLVFNKEYGDLLEQQKKNTTDNNITDSSLIVDSNADTDGIRSISANSAESPMFELEFYVLPGETKSIRIFGLYAENPLTADPAKELLDALLYEGKKHSLKKVLEQKG